MAMPKRGSDLDRDEAKRVREGIQQLLLRDEFRLAKRPNYAALGRALGLTGQALSQMLDGKNEPSVATAKVVATRLGIHWTQLLTGVSPSTTTVVYDERYPNRGQAIAAARALGFSEEAIERVRSIALSRPDDPSPREWMRKLEAAEDDVRSEQLAESATPKVDPARQDELERATKPKLPKRPQR